MFIMHSQGLMLFMLTVLIVVSRSGAFMAPPNARGSFTNTNRKSVQSTRGGATLEQEKHHIDPRRTITKLSYGLDVPKPYRSAEWIGYLVELPTSPILHSIVSHLTFSILWGAVVSYLYILAPARFVGIPTVPHSIMSSALGLLLVFRNNAAYDRLQEARKAWGSIITSSRNLARLSFEAFDASTAVDKFLPLIKLFPWTLKQHLQKYKDDDELKVVGVQPAELETVQESVNPPLAACYRMTQLVMHNGKIGKGDEAHSIALVKHELQVEIGHLIAALTNCERILTKPVPRSYTCHTSRFLSLYLFTLPLVLVPQTKKYTCLVMALVSWGLLSIEAISYYIEQPFTKATRRNSIVMDNLLMDVKCRRVMYDADTIAALEKSLHADTKVLVH